MDLATPQKFDVYSEPNSVARRWERYVKTVQIYMAARGINNVQRQRAILLHCAGTDIQDIADNNISDTGMDFETLANKLAEYFACRNNVVFERYEFRQCLQLDDETIDSWSTRLRMKASTCEYKDQTESIIRDQIVACCTSCKLRRKLLEVPNISLADTLKIARSFEAAERQAQTIEQKPETETPVTMTTDELSALHPKPHFPSRKQQNQQYRRRSAPPTCYRCGEQGHRACEKARGKTCGRCGKKNHFAKACRSFPGATKDVNEVRTESVHFNPSPASSGDEIFTLHGSPGELNSAHLSLLLNGHSITLLVDSGASVNVLPVRVYRQITTQETKLQPTSTQIFPYGSQRPLTILGVCTITVDAFGKQLPVEFVVVNHDGITILGRTTSTKLGILHVGLLCNRACGLHNLDLDPAALSTHKPPTLQTSQPPDPQPESPMPADTQLQPTPIPEPAELPPHLQQSHILNQYKDVFTGLGCVKGVEVEIHMKKGTTPVVHPPSRVPVHLRAALDKELDIQESLGIIEPVDGPTPWVSRIVVVPKSTPGQVRITQDWRDVNAHVEREIQPIPTFEEATDEMSGANVWSKLDMFKSFHQIPLHPNSRKYATFWTPRGLRRCTTLVMGFTNSSEILQRVMNMVLSGLTGVKWIHDDITVYGQTVREHNERLASCLQRLQEFNITLNKDKCIFGVDQVTFMAMQLSAKGIQPSQFKVDAVKSFKTPCNVSEVKSFLGLINFLARFIPNLATIAEPLRRLTRSSQEWSWGIAQQRAFNHLKDSISSDSCLVFFDRTRKTELRVDASPVGLGAILCQIQEDGSSRPVAYASRSLSAVERRYSQIEREALGVKFGCLKFDHYLSGDPGFTVITDHKPLLGLYRPGSRPPPRIERWALRIQHLNFQLRYEPGPKNPADVFSRQPTPPRAHINPSERKDTRSINTIIATSLPKACTLEQVQQATANDKTLQAVLIALQSGSWSKDLAPFYCHRNEFTFSENVLLRSGRIVIPHSLQHRVIELAHQGHQGIAKTKARLRSKVWWPGMSTQAEKFVKECRPCVVTEIPTPQYTPLKPTHLPDAPWLLLGMDFTGPFPTGENLLVLIDYYSRYPEVEIMKSITTSALEPRLRRIFARYGIPREIVTDNAKTFRSSQFADLMAELGIKHRKITPRYPRANGEVERINRSINKVVKTAVAESRDWRKAVYVWLAAYRTTPHTVTGQPPARMMFGRDINDKLPSIHHAAVTINQKKYRQRDSRKKRASKRYHDEKNKARAHSIKVGDSVLIRSEKKGKLVLPWDPSTFRVTAVKGGSVIVEREGQRFMRHTSAIKKIPDGNIAVPAPQATQESSRRNLRSTHPPPDYYGFNSIK